MVKKHPDYKLTPYERETVINMNEAEDTAEVYTYKRKYKKRLAQLLKDYPELCVLKDNVDATPEEIDQLVEDSQECLWVSIPWKWVKLSPPKKRDLTEEQRAELVERMKKAREARLNGGANDDSDSDDDEDDDERSDEE